MKFEAAQFKSLFEAEESVLKYWHDHQIFEKSLQKNPPDKVFSFYDGPPFITGTPHYGTLLPSIVKDVIPRYQTMRGFRVRRRWGWDVHGLPAENQVEKQLGLKTKKDIEKLGIDKFIAACRQYVAETSDAWRWYIDHIGRWADMDNAYRTDQLDYMESVMRAFKQLYDQDLIYRGRRTSLYCPRCATPLSKFEVTMDEGSYRDVEDPALTVAFKLKDEDTFILAWTTTPWTLPANRALAVSEEAEYVKVTNGHQAYIVAHQALERYRDEDLEIIETFKGRDLIGKAYEPLYSFGPIESKHDHRLYAADFVSMEEGTGVVHIAPGFGEDDSQLGEAVGLSLFESIDAEGHFLESVQPWFGQYYKKANPLIAEDLRKRGLIFKEEKITHSYPHCYRCETPLIYKAQVAWFLKIDTVRDQLVATNQQINWVPKHFGSGRFQHNLETAPDWSLSRTRYWGSPIPVWETDDGELFVPESIKQLEELSGKKITDLHRPFIDEVELTLPSGKKAGRVTEVLDCWFESGAMPYAQDHYPFENNDVFEQHFPADFIIEYTGQLRGWFYYLHVLANALKNSPAFKNVIVTGVLMGSDGRKMSKSYGNYPDPKITIEKYGGEALRLYFLTSKVMLGEDPSISEEEIREQSRLINILHNSFRYFLTYAELHTFEPSPEPVESTNVLDRWLRIRLNELIDGYSRGLEALDVPAAHRLVRPFIEDLSTWFIRRSRERFVAGDRAALQTLYDALLGASRALAPSLPFTSELMYRTLTQAESVHLSDYPTVDSEALTDTNTLTLVEQVRLIASATHKLRSEAGLNLRQPLETLAVNGFEDLAHQPEFIELLQEEVNVRTVTFGGAENAAWLSLPVENGSIHLDTELTPALKEEGELREVLRLLQEARKHAGLQVGQTATLYYRSTDPVLTALLAKHAETIRAQANFQAVVAAPAPVATTPLPKSLLEVAIKP